MILVLFALNSECGVCQVLSVWSRERGRGKLLLWRMVRQSDGRFRQTVGGSDSRTVGQTVGRSDGQTVRRSDGQMVGRSDGQMVGWMVGWSDGQMVGQSDSRTVWVSRPQPVVVQTPTGKIKIDQIQYVVLCIYKFKVQSVYQCTYSTVCMILDRWRDPNCEVVVSHHSTTPPLSHLS